MAVDECTCTVEGSPRVNGSSDKLERVGGRRMAPTRIFRRALPPSPCFEAETRDVRVNTRYLTLL